MGIRGDYFTVTMVDQTGMEFFSEYERRDHAMVDFSTVVADRQALKGRVERVRTMPGVDYKGNLTSPRLLRNIIASFDLS